MWRFITDISAVISTEWAEKKIKTVPYSAKSINIIDMMETRTILRTISEQFIVSKTESTSFIKKLCVVVLVSAFKNKNSLRTIEARIVQTLKNNEAGPKFTGSYF